MHDLTLIGVHEDGQHLLLADASGAKFRLPLDETLRVAARKDRPRLGQLQIEIDGGLRPRDVQSLIRQGLSAAEVADRSGWSIEKVRRFEGPILAEREWMAIKAQGTSVATDGSAHPTLAERTLERFRSRGVDQQQVEWDSARLESGQWVVTVSFPAGGRQRSASWRFDPATGALRAQNDDARWLGEDDRPSHLPTPHSAEGARSDDEVFDVTAPARGRAQARPAAAGRRSGNSGAGQEPTTEDELTSSIRAHHSNLRDRRGRRRAQASSIPGEHTSPTEVLPLEPLAIDLEDIDPPPARPRPSSPPPESPHEVPKTASAPEPHEQTLWQRRQDAAPPSSPSQKSTAPTTAPRTPVPAEPSTAPPPPRPLERPSHSPSATPTPTDSEDQSPPAGGRRGRARVPAWDDVVFGTRSRTATPEDD